jgi:hypothetical protein
MSVQMKIVKTTTLLLFVILFFACKSENKRTESDSSSFVRYEKLLFKLDTTDLKHQFEELQKKYPDFTDIFFKNVVTLSGYEKKEAIFYQELNQFITDTNNLRVLKMVEEEFSDFSSIEKRFDEIVLILRKLYPDIKKPRFYTFVSMFSYQGFIFTDNGEDGLAIGLDMFLGDKFPYSAIGTNENVFANYMVRTYNKDHLYKKTVQLWLEDRIFKDNGMQAIDHIIENGKKLYLLKKIIPETPDSVLFEYSGKQMQWMEKNEQEMWSFFIKNNFFYTTDEYKIKRLTTPGPNSQALGMPVNSPGQTGNYLGYKIVQSYLTRNNEDGIVNLINNKGSQKILEASKYKPKQK